MKEWYAKQTPRDQKIVMAVAVLVILGLLFALVVHPLRTGLEDRRVSVEAKQNDLDYIRNAGAQIRAAGGAGATGRQTSNKAAYVLLDEAIGQAGLSSAVERVEPAGADRKGARAQFGQVDFDKLILVLGQLEGQYGLTVSRASISRKSGGLVSARITLEVPQ